MINITCRKYYLFCTRTIWSTIRTDSLTSYLNAAVHSILMKQLYSGYFIHTFQLNQLAPGIIPILLNLRSTVK